MIDTPDYSISPNQKISKTNPSKSSRRETFYRFLIYLVLLSLGGGLSYCWYFLTQKLVPLIEKPVSNYLSMDVELGKVEAVSWNSLRLGKSEIRTLDNDNDYVIAEEVEISINPWQLWQKKVVLGIKIIQPNGYLKQNEDRSWLNLNLPNENQSFHGFIFNVDNISLAQGLLSVQPQGQEKLFPLHKAKIENARIDFHNSLNSFNVKGNLIDGGNFRVEGVNKYKIHQWLININGNNLATNTVTKLNLFDLPLTANEGNLDVNLLLKFDNLRISDIQGTIYLDQISVKLPSVYPLLTNTHGSIYLKDRQINLANLQTNFGLIPTTINGIIDNQNKLNLEIESKIIDVAAGIKTFNLPQPIIATKGKVKGKVTVTGDLAQPKVNGTITNVNSTTIDQLTVNSAEAELTIFDSQLTINQVTLYPDIGGKITGMGNVSLDDNIPTFNLDWQVEGIDGKKLADAYRQELPIEIGLLTGEYNLSGNWRQLSSTKLTGIASFPVAGGKATVKNLQLQNNQLSADVNLSQLNLQQLPQLNCQQLGCENSVLDGEFKLFGNVNDISPETINLVGDFKFNFADGEVNLKQTRLNQGDWQTLVLANNLDIDKLPFFHSTDLIANSSISPREVKQSNVVGSQQLSKRNVEDDNEVNNYDDNSYDGESQTKIDNSLLWRELIKQSQLSTKLRVKGNLANLPQTEIDGKGKVELPQGKININQLTLINDNLTANFSTNQLAIADFGNELRGEASGEITIKGNVNHFTPDNVEIKGDLNFNQGIGVIKQHLFTSFTYDGDKIWLDNASIQGISAKGVIDYDFNQSSVKHFDLDINAKEIDLQQLPFPNQFDFLAYQGKANFQGNLVGDFSQPQLRGNVTLNNFSLLNLPFTPLMGNLTASPQQGIDLNMVSAKGKDADKLEIQLDNNYQPQFINLLADKTQLTATNKQQTLDITVNNLPLTPLTQPYLTFLPSKIQQIGGEVSARMNLNLDTYDFNLPEIIINQPSVNHLQGDLLTAKLSSRNGIVTVTEGKLNHKKNEYEFAGEFQLNSENPQMQAELTIAEGDIQDVLTSLEIFEVADISKGFQPRNYAKAEDLYQEEEKQKEKSQPQSKVSPKPLSVTEFGYDDKFTAEALNEAINPNFFTTAKIYSSKTQRKEIVTHNSNSVENSQLTPDVVTGNENNPQPPFTDDNSLTETPLKEKQRKGNLTDNLKPVENSQLTPDVVTRMENNPQPPFTDNPLTETPPTHRERKGNLTDNLNLVENHQLTPDVVTGNENNPQPPFTDDNSLTETPLKEKQRKGNLTDNLNPVENSQLTPDVVTGNKNNPQPPFTDNPLTETPPTHRERKGNLTDNLNPVENHQLTPDVVTRMENNPQPSFTDDNSLTETPSTQKQRKENLTDNLNPVENNQLNPDVVTRMGNNSQPQLTNNSLTETPSSQKKRKENLTDNLNPVENNQLTPDVVTRNENNPQPQLTDNSVTGKKPLAEVGNNNQSLLERINLLEKIETQLNQQKIQQQLNSTLPPLENLEGKFVGKINLAFSRQTGINAEFNLQGDNWEWGIYQVNLIQVQGSYQNGLLTLLPIKIQENNSTISLTGTFHEERISGQIIVEDLPVTEIDKVINLPDNLNIKGEINANIAISGNQEYPLAKGSFAIDKIEINGTQIDSINSSFGYKNSRINFLTNSNLQENEKTLTITGSLPFQLFFNSIQPETDNFEFNLSMTKNGFNLLNIITNNQLNWIDGEGNLNLDITGNYQQSSNKIRNLQTQGVINLQDGIMTANILPDKPLTNINGQILFDFDKLTIPNLSGDFSGGNISIQGDLPLTEDTINKDSLNINLEDIALNLNKLYQGNAQGEIIISGKVIAPEISGNLEIFNGKIQLAESFNHNSKSNVGNNSWLAETKINNFDLILGENIVIGQAPLLWVKATGNINFNGDLQEIKPEGLINLKSGKINLFTSQLKLSESYENIAKITPENAFNPYLDIELEGSVTEASRHQFIDNANTNEIRDLSNSTVTTAQTIKVKAKIKGLSSNLKNKLELSSSPQRSESEIIALLGGGFFNNFAEGDHNLGLANLASAAVLGSFQGELREALGFDEFRFFPTQILDPEKRTSTMGFGAEIGIDLTQNFSVSVFKILTNEQQPQYSLRYRINDQLNLRGSSDFNRDSRGAIEFQHHF